MELDSTDSYLKDNLENIMNGEWDDQLDKDQLEMANKNSFILNNIIIENKCAIFEYADQKIKFDFQNQDPSDFALYGLDLYSYVITNIRNSDIFMSAYTAFKRDWKINKIIE
jgi:hypothetical protein